jgi:DNA-binding NarL/FixJ family response regulator
MNYLYAPESVAERNHIFDEISEVLGDASRLEMFEDVDALSARLQRFNNPEIMILLAVGKKDMPQIIALFGLMRNADVIVMLSQEEPDTITSAIRMRPRFLGIMDGDMDKIVPIIRKLVQKRKSS